MNRTGDIHTIVLYTRCMVQRVDIGARDDDLLLMLAEELKQPLINIAHLSELNADARILTQAQKALNTIDNITLYRQFVSGQLSLNLEPVHVGSAIAQVASTIEPQMKMSGCWTELSIQNSLQTADIDRRVLSGALLSLWQAFIESIDNPTEIVCSAKKMQGGIRLSIVSKGANIESLSFSGANTSSTQPIVGFAGPATDLITARNMFELVGGKMTKSRRKDMSGIGVTLRTSQQLHLV